MHTDVHTALQYSGCRALPILGDLRGYEPMNHRFESRNSCRSHMGPALTGDWLPLSVVESQPALTPALAALGPDLSSPPSPTTSSFPLNL
jgi:hypothetical protein